MGRMGFAMMGLPFTLLVVASVLMWIAIKLLEGTHGGGHE